MRMMVQRKLTVLLCCITLASMAGLAFIKYSQNKTFAVLSQNLGRSFDEHLAATETPISTFVNDYSYWDDLVLFLKTGNTAWASRNFDSCLSGFKTNALWIYKTDATPLYAVNDSGAKDLGSLPLPKDALKSLFAKSRFCHFYVQVPKGLMEVYGATIHPTKDSARLTEPRGYLLAGRFWNENFVGDLGRFTGNVIEITPSGTPSTGKELKKDDMVIYARQLTGWDGTAVKTVWIGTVSPMVKEIERSQTFQFRTMAALLAAIIGFLYVFVAYWVSRPLGLLYRGLDSEDPAISGKLRADRSEFGYIAQLVTRVFEQKAQLLSETAHLREIKEILTKDNESLSVQIAEFGEEMFSLKDSLKQVVDDREQVECLAREVEDLQTARKILTSAYTEMERQLDDAGGRLEVINELLQRETLNAHEQHDAALTLDAEKQRLEMEIAALKAELVNRERELLADTPIVRPTIIIDKKMKDKKKDLPEISFQANC